MKFLLNTALSLTLVFSANSALAACDAGEIVIKFSHVTNTDKHPKGIAATLLEQRVNDEMNGKACLEVFPNSTLYNDNQVLEALLQGDVQRAMHLTLAYLSYHIRANPDKRPDTSAPVWVPPRATWQMFAGIHEVGRSVAHLVVQRGGRTKSHHLLRYALPRTPETFLVLQGN